jgi:putative glutamine amidotransferase
MSLLIGIPACAIEQNEHLFHRTPARYAEAVLDFAVPVMIPPLGERMVPVLDHLDGLLLPGSPSNVHPSHYQGGESETPNFHDPARDSTTLPLIRAAIARGIPVLAICRGVQELNVALGGSLIQRVHVQPGRDDHRGGPGEIAARYRPKHPITVRGLLADIVGADSIVVNSVHGQAIDRLAPGLAVDATAPDGTIEAVSMPCASGWVLGVQWHPEWRHTENPHSLAIFTAFGAACLSRQTSNRKAA